MAGVWVSCPAEDSPRGLGRTLGKRVGVTPSRVRISYPPRAPGSTPSAEPRPTDHRVLDVVAVGPGEAIVRGREKLAQRRAIEADPFGEGRLRLGRAAKELAQTFAKTVDGFPALPTGSILHLVVCLYHNCCSFVINVATYSICIVVASWVMTYC